MKTKLLRDVMTRGAMTRGVITISVNETCKHIAKLLSEKDISGVCIIGDDGKAVGVISEMDILKVIGMENWENKTAESIMTSNLETVEPNTTLIEAANIMRMRHVHRLLVLSEGGIGMSQKPIGILSISDIIREAAKN
jgi:CBS domain-containing protein